MAAFWAGALLAAVAALTPAERATVEASIAEIYRPYSANPDNPTASWERPIWSAPVRALIARWQQVMPEGEVDDLNDGDWLCLCQDWDAASFRATVTQVRPQRPGVALAAVRVQLGNDQVRAVRLVLRREGQAWKIDDMFGPTLPRGLRQALRETIAADLKLRK